MTFLFEEHSYSDTDCLKSILGNNSDALSCLNPSMAKLNAVGYFYNATPKEEYKYPDSSRSVFILPKVFLKGTGISVFDGKSPEEFLPAKSVGNSPLSNADSKFLSNLGLYLWAAIAKYHEKFEDKDAPSSVITPPRAKVRRYHHGECDANLINVTLSLREFYKENRELFVFIAKNKHSGVKKVNWQKTISKNTPFFQDDFPIYMELVGKRKVFDLDDTLIVLYFSAMNYINRKFGIDMPKSDVYKPMQIGEIENLLNGGRGLRLLRRIKYKYFADKFLKLYNILLGFFEWGGRFHGNGIDGDEYLLVKDFNLVFETMIDALISDDDVQTQQMKNLKDGKIVDHLYKEKSLIFANSDKSENLIWHIGDSKYYKDEHEVLGASIAKQYTYAKNIIQNYFSPEYFEKQDLQKIHKNIRYRDSLTEGYNVTPNFFIRGYIPEDTDAKSAFRFNGNAELRLDSRDACSLWKLRNRHFENRLFDRDTLLLQAYDINFLYVLYAYTAKNDSARTDFRTAAHAEFRKNFLKLLDEHYVFWALYPKSIKEFVKNNFQLLLGKMFTNSGNSSSHIIFALERETPIDKYNEIWSSISSEICEAAIITPCEAFGSLDNEKECANFGSDAEYDAMQNGFWINFNAFEKEIIGNGMRIPAKINGRKLRGNFIPEYKQAEAPADPPKRFLLPCL